MGLPIGHLAGLGEGFKKSVPVAATAENGFRMIPAIREMTNRSSILDSHHPSHAED